MVDSPLSTVSSYERKRAIRDTEWPEFCVEHNCVGDLSQAILMHSLSMPFVHRSMAGQGMTDWNKIEGNYVVGQLEY